jgi:hypothetical protein
VARFWWLRAIASAVVLFAATNDLEEKTVAFQHGKSAYFNLDTVGNSPTDLSAYCDNIDMPQELETAETTVFGNSAKTYIAGLQGASISVSGPWDPTLDAHMTAIQAAPPSSSTFIVGPQGSTAGQRKYTGECHVTNYSVSAPVGDKVTWSADLLVTGAVTRTTF